MKVILLKDVGGVGQKDTVQEVSDGYALNQLIPSGLVIQATPEKLTALKAKQALGEERAAAQEKEQADLSRRIEGITVEVLAKTNERGHLYNQLSPEIVRSVLEKRTEKTLPANCIVFDKTVREVGEWKAQAKLGAYTPRFTVVVKGAE